MTYTVVFQQFSHFYVKLYISLIIWGRGGFKVSIYKNILSFIICLIYLRCYNLILN